MTRQVETRLDPLAELEGALQVLQQTKSNRTPRALELGGRGYEPSDSRNLTRRREAQKEYLNLADACAAFLKALQQANGLDVLAEHATLERAAAGSKFPYRIPPVPTFEGASSLLIFSLLAISLLQPEWRRCDEFRTATV